MRVAVTDLLVNCDSPRFARTNVVPISQSVSEHVIFRLAAQIPGVSPHAVVLRRQQFPISVKLISRPGAENRRASPFRRITKVRAHSILIHERNVFGGDTRYHAIRQLGVANILRHFLVETDAVVIEQDRRTRQVGLLQPAELFAMRTIRQHAEHIAQDGAIYKLIDLPQELA